MILPKTLIQRLRGPLRRPIVVNVHIAADDLKAEAIAKAVRTELVRAARRNA